MSDDQPPPGSGGPMPPPGGDAPGGYPRSAGQPGAAGPANDKLAVWSVVAGAVGLLFFGLILGVVAIWLSVRARQRIAASGGQLKGGGLATAGMVLGIIDIAASVLQALFVLG